MRQRKTYRITAFISILMILIAVLGFVFLEQFKIGIMHVYARQQDAYVKLVLDQINLKKDGSGEYMINDIISTLDSSNKRYWTLAEDNSLIFVKNVQETNRYKGFTTKTFFSTEEGMEFVDDLKLNYISHSFVEMEGEEYIVSGTRFSYNGREYTISLMTDRDVVLEENAFLAADIMLRVVLVSFLLLSFFTLIGLSHGRIKLEKELAIKDDHIKELNQTVARLNHRITRHDMFHPRWNIYQESVFDSFIDGFDKKGVSEYGICFLRFENEEKKTEFLKDAFVYLDRKVLRFQMDEYPLIIFLLYINMGKSEMERSMEHFYISDSEIMGMESAGNKDEVMNAYHRFCDMAGDEQ